MAERTAAVITPGRDLAGAIERVRHAEALGYEAAFVTQTTARDGLTVVGAYAPHTERIKLGPGVQPALPRHPVAMAIEAATLDEVTGGRLILGLGMGHAITMKNWYGLDYTRPLSQFKEYVAIVRSILSTGRASFSGEFYTVDFAFMGYEARPDLPIYTASLGPNSLRWAGANVDGVVLWSCMPSYIREVVVPTIAEGAREAGRDPADIDIVAAVPVAVADDVDAARDALRKQFFVYLTLPFYRRVIAGAGYQEELKVFDDALSAGDNDAARAAMTDAMLDEFAGIGTPEVVRAKLREYREAGVTTPAVGPISVPKEVGPGVDVTLEEAIAS